MKLIREFQLAYEFPEIRGIILRGIACLFLFWIVMPITLGMRAPSFIIGYIAHYILTACEWLSDNIPSPSGYFYYKRQEYIYDANKVINADTVILKKE